jgi:hypothetical protein
VRKFIHNSKEFIEIIDNVVEVEKVLKKVLNNRGRDGFM